MNNGWVTEMFKNTRGIRQGCPLSALLFVLSVEIMASRLRNNKDIKGFQIKIDEKTHSIKISQLADDTTLFCTSKEEIYIAFNEIETFGSFSGLLMNKNKTGGIWVGKLKHSKDKIEGIKWYEKPIKTLGVYFGNNKEDCEKLNWENKIDKMNTLFFSWGKRNLTILGKIMIIKALVIPIFTFVASACVVPDKYRKEIESKCFKFIWDGKPDKVKRNTMIGNFEMGGLNMIDIGSYFASLRASWVSRFVSGEMDNWKLIPYKYFRQFGKNWLIFSMNIEYKKIKDYLRYIPDFYKEILQTLIKIGGGQTKTLTHFAEIRKQLIWGNKFIMFKNKSLMFDNWINSDLIYINDILNENGEISQNLILDKLKYKNNWISEFICLKKAIPNEWYHTLQAQNSIKSVVNFQKDKFIVNGKCKDPSQLSNKYSYNEYVNVNFLKPIGINTWLRYLSINEKPNMSQLYSFIFHYLEENKLKIFRWKLLQYIIPTKKLLMKWRIAINSQCNFCGQDEDYLHYFMYCPYLKEFWVKIQQILKKSNIENFVTLKHIVFGYKIFDKDYFDFNYFLTILGFSIYKAYYVSEQKTKQVNIFFICERIYYENKPGAKTPK